MRKKAKIIIYGFKIKYAPSSDDYYYICQSSWDYSYATEKWISNGAQTGIMIKYCANNYNWDTEELTQTWTYSNAEVPFHVIVTLKPDAAILTK